MKSILKIMVSEYERKVLLGHLLDNNFNQSKTARLLGIHRNTLIIKMKRLKINRKGDPYDRKAC